MTLTEKLVEPIYSYKYEELPKEVIEKAKLCITHALSCAYAGINARWSKACRDMAKELVPDGNASIWFSEQTSNMQEAAFVNAVYVQSILYEDIHRDSNAHPGVIIVPTAFAVGEEVQASTEEILTAIVAGYEMMARIGRGTNSPDFAKRGFRPTSIIGTFGSCMTAGRLLGLTLKEQETAFSLAASLTSGINQWAVEGTDDLYIQNGNAAKSGIVAALLAKRGLTAPKAIIEGEAGICAAFGFSQENLEALDSRDGHYSILDVLFKPAPACALVQTTAQAALDVGKAGIKPEDIIKGVIYTFKLGTTYAGCDNASVFENPLQARMSNQYNFVVSLCTGKITNANYYEYEDEAFRKLAGVMELKEEPLYTAQFPNKQPVRIELHLSNGEEKIFYREEPVYLDENAIIAKLYEHCEKDMKKEQIDKVTEKIAGFEQLENLGELLKCFH